MHDDDLGKLCVVCCKRDYIPYFCIKCTKHFCDEHFKAQNHLCTQLIPKSKGGRDKQSSPKPVYFCKVCNKPLTPINYFYCSECETLLCLAHRLPEGGHQCKTKSGCFVM